MRAPSFSLSPALRASLVMGLTAFSLAARPVQADPPPALAPLAITAPPPAPAPRSDPNRALRFTGGIAVGGFGLVMFALGSVLGVRAIVDKDQIGSHCNAALHCDLIGYTLASEAQDFAQISTAGLAMGVPALAAGIALAITGAPKNAGGLAWVSPGPGSTVALRW